jgi:RNA polymerase sigma-70 factor (ECF subfamily)
VERVPLPDTHAALLAEAAWVRRLARRLVADEALAADIAQDVLAAAIDRPPPFVLHPRRLRGWLRKVAYHIALRAQHERHARRTHEAVAARSEASNTEADTAERLHLHHVLTDAVAALPEPYRGVVVQRWFDELEPAEIAQRRGVRADLVRQQLHRAHALLRARLDRELGGRRAWIAALAGVMRTGALPPVAPLTLGAITMKKLAAAALTAIVLVAAATWVIAFPPGTGDPPRAVVDRAAAAAAPVHERAATEAARVRTPAAAAAELVLAVVDPRAVALVGATVWRWGKGVVPVCGKTDERGSVRLAGAPGEGSVLVVAAGRLPHLEAIAALVGEHRVIVDGEELQGWVRVDGVPPREPLDLIVESDAPLGLAELPEVLVAALEKQQVCLQRIRVATRADGSFTLAGLPGNWSGRLCAPQPFWFRPGEAELASEHTLLLRAPRTGLNLELTALPALRGRVVWGDDRTPVAGAGVDVLTARFEDGRSSPGMGISADANGRFHIGLYPAATADMQSWADPAQRSPLATVQLRIHAPGAVQATMFERGADQMDPHGDVGVLEIERGPRQHVVVRDATGAPVFGARIHAGDTRARTDAEGRTAFDGPPPVSGYLVGALGFRVQRLTPRTGTGSADDPFVLQLERGNTLTLRLRDASGGVPPVEHVLLSSQEPLFDGDTRWGATYLHQELGTGFGGASWNESGGEASYMPDRNGCIMLAALQPEVRITVVAFDALRNPVVEQEVVGPGPTEQKTIDIAVPGEPFAVRGVVLDASGTPLPNADVIWMRERSKARARTGSDGRFVLEPVYVAAPAWTVRVRYPGCAVAELRDVSVKPEAQPLEIRMRPGHEVLVRVVDAEGGAVDVPSVQVEGAPEAIAQRLGPGEFVFADLPPDEVVFHCWIGRDHALPHDPLVPEVRLVVPAPGRLIVATQTAGHLSGDTQLETHVEGPRGSAMASLRESGGELATQELLLPAGEYSIELVERRKGQQPRMLGRKAGVVVRAGALARCVLSFEVQ